MNFQNDYPDFNPEQRELLNKICDERREIIESLKELKKIFSALKSKIKKYEQKIAMLHEEKDSLTIMHLSSNVQLALNKCITVEKRLKESSIQLKQFDHFFKGLRLFPSDSIISLKENLYRYSYPLNYCSSAIITIENELRIANKHLKKNDDHLAFIRKLYRNYPVHQRRII